MKKKVLVLILFIVILAGCTISSTPSAKVKELLNKYKNNDTVVTDELNDYLGTLNIDTTNYDNYKEIYLNQYEDLTYNIKNEDINDTTAVVTTEIEVYDYYSIESDVATYITSNPDEFMENDVYSAPKALSYKLDQLKKATKRVTYTIAFTLTNEELEKIHGTYAH